MKTRCLFLGLMGLFASSAVGQDLEDVPFHQIPEAPEAYTAGNVVARMVEGLGYRYYWATEGLAEKDLAYRPTRAARSTDETVTHIYDLSVMMVNALQKKTNVRTDWSVLSFAERRAGTLRNLEQTSRLLRGKMPDDLAELSVAFEGSQAFPYWNMINGPISDALYHTGQLVSFRRSSGNPMNPNVNVFLGQTREP